MTHTATWSFQRGGSPSAPAEGLPTCPSLIITAPFSHSTLQFARFFDISFGLSLLALLEVRKAIDSVVLFDR